MDDMQISQLADDVVIFVSQTKVFFLFMMIKAILEAHE